MIEPGAAAVRPALARLADTLEVRPFPLALGGNVFGWTADEAASFEVLDGFVAGGGTLFDTADGYSHWAPGHTGGESETIIGRWLAGRSDRDELAIASKVSTHPEFAGLAAANIRTAASGTDTTQEHLAVMATEESGRPRVGADLGGVVPEFWGRGGSVSGVVPELWGRGRAPGGAGFLSYPGEDDGPRR